MINKQIERLLSFGYAEAAGMNEDDFVKSIPEPEDARQNTLLVIPGAVVSTHQQCRILGVVLQEGSGKSLAQELFLAKDLSRPIPTAPYWIYDVEEGAKRTLLSDEVPGELESTGRRGLSIDEGIAWVLKCVKFVMNISHHDDIVRVPSGPDEFSAALLGTLKNGFVAYFKKEESRIVFGRCALAACSSYDLVSCEAHELAQRPSIPSTSQPIQRGILLYDGEVVIR